MSDLDNLINPPDSNKPETKAEIFLKKDKILVLVVPKDDTVVSLILGKYKKKTKRIRSKL